MKKLKSFIGVAALLATLTSAQAQTNTTSVWSQMLADAKTFIANNPTNIYDVSTYAVVSRNAHYGYGGGVRVGYWITPSVGAALDVNYADSSWMFTSLGLAGRGTINLSTYGALTLYATAGAGWDINSGASPTVVGVVGSGGNLHINGFDWFDMFGEYQYITLSPENQQRIVAGITRKF